MSGSADGQKARSEQEDEWPNWVVVTKHDKLLAGPFGPEETDAIMEAANDEQAGSKLKDVYVITESHFREIQDRWLPELRYYIREFGGMTRFVGRTETQFEMIAVGEEGDIQDYYYFDYESWTEQKADLEELGPSEVEIIPDEVRERLRHRLMKKERKAQRLFKQQYKHGEMPDDGAWNPLVKRRLDEQGVGAMSGDTAESASEAQRPPPLNPAVDELEYLWEMMKEEVGKEEVQYSDDREVVESLHTKVHDLYYTVHGDADGK